MILFQITFYTDLTMDSKSCKLFLLETEVKENLLQIYGNLYMKIMTILFPKGFNIPLSFLTRFICPFYLKMWPDWMATILCNSHKTSPKISRRDFPVKPLTVSRTKLVTFYVGHYVYLVILRKIYRDSDIYFLEKNRLFPFCLLHMKTWNIFSVREDIRYYHHHNITILIIK